MEELKFTLILFIVFQIMFSCNIKENKHHTRNEKIHFKEFKGNTYDGNEHKLYYLWVANENELIEYKVKSTFLNNKIEYSQTHSNGFNIKYNLYLNRKKLSFQLAYTDTTWINFIDSLKIPLENKQYTVYKFKELARQECLDFEGDSIACELDLFFIKDYGVIIDKNRMCIMLDEIKSETLIEIFNKTIN